jgi:hypothetical protein
MHKTDPTRPSVAVERTHRAQRQVRADEKGQRRQHRVAEVADRIQKRQQPEVETLYDGRPRRRGAKGVEPLGQSRADQRGDGNRKQLKKISKSAYQRPRHPHTRSVLWRKDPCVCLAGARARALCLCDRSWGMELERRM